jgi:putative intracellular protease/amidase
MKPENVLFVILDEYADWEAASLAAALNEKPEQGEQKYGVKTVSLTKEPISSIGDFRTVPDYAVEEVGDDFAGLVLIGGNSWRKEESQTVMKLVQKALDGNKVLGAICDATVFLGMNGVLNDISHTSNRLHELQEAAGENYTNEAQYQEQQAVRTGNIITANGSAFLEFGKEVMTALESAPQAEIDEWYDFFKSGYHEFMKKRAGQK